MYVHSSIIAFTCSINRETTFFEDWSYFLFKFEKMRKNKKITFRVSLKEKAEIKRLSGELGYDSMSEYLLSIALSGLPHFDVMLDLKELNSLRERNISIENNINQMAKHLNIHKEINEAQFNEYLKMFKDFTAFRYDQNEQLNELLKKILDSKKV